MQGGGEASWKGQPCLPFPQRQTPGWAEGCGAVGSGGAQAREHEFLGSPASLLG